MERDDLVEIQQRVLGLLARGLHADDVLDTLCRLIEAGIGEGAVCSIMRIDPGTGNLHLESAPCMPPELAASLDGLVPGPLAGSCGASVYTGETVLVEDTLSDPRWEGMRDQAREFGIRACWSIPVLGGDDEPLGTFAISSDRPRLPDEREAAMLDAAGSLTEVVFERERSEERQAALEAKLRQAQKMEAIGRLAGGVAHDFNNLLTPITAYAECVLAGLPSESEAHTQVERILDAAHRATELTNQLLAFSRKQVLELATVDLDAEVRSAAEMLSRLIPESIAIALDLSGDLPPVRVDRGQLQQILLNLATNARDAMPDGGELRIATACDREGSGEVVLTVSDTGVGMTPEITANAVEPFFTTKPRGKGTGLGLSTVYGIVRQHGAKLHLGSRHGQGTRVEVRFPSAPSAAPSPPPALPRRADGATGATGANGAGAEPAADPGPVPATVLVVEDDDAVRELVEHVLTDCGHRVLAASSPLEAIELADRDPGPIDLLLTDVILPQMNGRSLYETLALTNADAAVLYMSGYSEDVIGRQGVLEAGVHFLSKPFSSRELSQSVRDALGMRRESPAAG